MVQVIPHRSLHIQHPIFGMKSGCVRLFSNYFNTFCIISHQQVRPEVVELLVLVNSSSPISSIDAARRLVADSQQRGAGQNYLIQHSAGSGKSNTIAWLSHRLSILHGTDDKRVFDAIIILSDRRAR